MSSNLPAIVSPASAPASGITLTQASSQWSSRPADERYRSLEDLHAATTYTRAHSKEAQGVPYSTLRVEASGADVLLVGKANVPSKLTHHAFGQLAARVGAPAGYLRDLPPTLAVQNLNHGLKGLGAAEDKANLLLQANGGYTVRALTSDRYTRIWDADITSRLIRLNQEDPSWQPAPAAFDGSRGLYASDHDVFAFMVDNDRRIFEKDPNGGLGRGFFVWNSEVGAASFGVTTFYFEYVCGNHRVWGAQGVVELRLRHVGNADERAFSALAVELKRYAEGSAAEDESKVTRARAAMLGATKDEVLDRVFGLRIPALSRSIIGAGYDKAIEREAWYGSPRSAWGLTGGITEIARDLPHTDARLAVDRAAGKLLERVAF